MRIGLISREFPPFTGGGIGAYTSRLAHELAARSHAVLVLTVSDDGREHRETIGAVDVLRIPFLRNNDWSRPDPAIDSPEIHAAFHDLCPTAALSLCIQQRLTELLDEHTLDVLEFPDTGALAWFTLNARRLGAITTPPIVICAHSPTAWVNHLNRDPGVDRVSRALVELETDCFRWADAVVCPSHALATKLQAEHDITVDAIPLPLGELADLDRAAPTHAPRRLLYAGRLEPRKGLDLLLAAFTQALDKGADLHLDIAGADTIDVRTRQPFGDTAIERLVPRTFRNAITLHDKLDPAALADLRTRAAAAVIPSPDDNYPYTCVEAMSAGLPVIANRAGGMAEMIRDGLDGHLLAPTVNAWTESLVTIARADDIALTTMGDAARARIRAICNNDSITQQRIEHYQRAIDDGSTPNPAPPDTPVVTINAGRTSENDLAALAGAARRTHAFAVGWRLADRLTAAPTPSTRWMALVDDAVGALCLERDTLDRLRDTLPPLKPLGDHLWCDDMPALVRALLTSGVDAAVVPHAHVDASVAATRGGAPTTDPTCCTHDQIIAAALRRARQARRQTPSPPAPPSLLTTIKRALGRDAR